MKNNFLAALVGLVGVTATISDSNAAVFCTGVVGAVGVDPGGVVSLYSATIAPDFVYVCQVGGAQNNTSSDACKAVLATLLAAKATGVPVRWAFSDAVACGQRPGWTWLQNWYWGPIAAW